jgi:hypothetical protein
MKNRTGRKVLAILLACMLISPLSACTQKEDTVTTSAAALSVANSTSLVVDESSIAIPGFGSLDFEADTKEQKVNFYNPKENTCLFRMTLVLHGNGEPKEEDAATSSGSAGGEDEGIVLWTSEMVEPGEEIKTITLNQKLKKGKYSAQLQYECFTLENQSQLNGSNIEFTLNVK